MKGKVTPQAFDAEVSLLGSCMLNNECAELSVERLTPESFYTRKHQQIFDAVTKIVSRSEGVDMVTVAQATKGEVEPAYIAGLTDIVPSKHNFRGYIRAIRDTARLRQIIKLGEKAITDCYSTSPSKAEETIYQLEKVFFSASQTTKGFSHIGPTVADAYETILKIAKGEMSTVGMQTGYDDFDSMTSGLAPGDLVILAGRPSMGKSALAFNIAENVAKRGISSGFFSLEMSKESLAVRALSSLSRIDSYRLRSGKLTKGELIKLEEAKNTLGDLGMYIDDTAGLSMREMRSKARRLKAEKDIGVIFLDYLQLGSGYGQSREQEVSSISRECKAMAKELSIPVIALSQLNRSCEMRIDKRPLLSDLRESGAIEQDADIISFLYRDEVYNKDENNPKKGIAELIIGKQRNGPTGTVELTWIGGATRFENTITMHERVH